MSPGLAESRGDDGGRTHVPPAVYGIRLVQLGSTGPKIEPPEWVTSFDPDGGDQTLPYPTGHVESHEDPKRAMRFASYADAMECWKQRSARTPWRPDGKPNRPMAAFTVEIVRLPDA